MKIVLAVLAISTVAFSQNQQQCLQTQLLTLNCDSSQLMALQSNPSSLCGTQCAEDIRSAANTCGLTGSNNPIETACGPATDPSTITSTTSAVTMVTTVSEVNCILQVNQQVIAANSTECARLLGDFPLGNPLSATEGQIAAYCSSTNCVDMLNNMYMTQCNSTLGPRVCSRDAGGYCATSARIQQLGTQLVPVLIGTCAGVDCTDTDCNQAVQMLSCCVSTIQLLVDQISSLSTLRLPANCQVQACFSDTTTTQPTVSTTQPSGAETLIAMPVAIILTVSVVVITTFGM